MKSRLVRFTLVFYLILLLCAGNGSSALAQEMTPVPDFEVIDAFVGAQVKDRNLPGLALGIVHGDEIVHLQSFGIADPSGRAITPQTPFRLASLTKSFTALAIMQLVETGMLELNAPVQEYLPWFRVADAGDSALITVRHLLQQTSGLSTLTGNSFLPIRDPSQPDMEVFVRSLSSADLTSTPGEDWQYSNANYVVLGLVIEAVSGESYEQYIEEHIFTPLDMNTSFLSEQVARQHGMAVGYQLRFGLPTHVDLPFPDAFDAAGGIISTSEDMSHYLIAHLNRGRYGDISLLSPAGLAQLWQPPASAQVDENSSYAMGWYVGAPYSLSGSDHSGGGGNFHAHMVVTPETGWGVVVLVNAEHLLLLTKPVEYIAWGVIHMLQGQTISPNADISEALYLGTFVIVALQLLSLIWGVLGLRLWSHQPESCPRGIWQLALRIVLPILLNLLVAYVFTVGLPQLAGLSFAAVLHYIPDWSYGFVLSAALAFCWLVWGIAVLVVLRQQPAPGSTLSDLQVSAGQSLG